MIKTFEELDAIADGCMESSNPNVEERHRCAGGRARQLAANDGDHFYRHEEASALLEAVALHETDEGTRLTTVELLFVAAMIAARAEGQPICFRPDEPAATQQLAAPQPTGYEEPAELPVERYTVRFTRQQINEHAYHIDVAASSTEDAQARFRAWAAGEIELTDAELQSERHVKDYGRVDRYGEPQLEDGFTPVERPA